MEKYTFIQNILHEAGAIFYTLRRQITHIQTHDKAGELVSDMDLQISNLVQEKITALGWEHILVLDEEKAKGLSPEKLNSAEYILIIDPIDGSGAALEGRVECCTMLGFFKNNGNGTFSPEACGYYRPITREQLIWSEKEGVTYTEQKGTKEEIVRQNAACANIHPPRNMLFDYRFQNHFRWNEAKTKARVGSSGFNIGEIALNRGIGFIFNYKPWDLVCLPLAKELGCESYFLTEENGAYTATKSGDFSLNWFDYDEEKQIFGKIKQKLLICRPENLHDILENLKPAF